ncbi:MAG: M20/M25/M40 family metallo-hydrolase, partial [Actinomycetota bacterium]|nr:M20/M25/M40 family metallo-hydrolase [Actinomycetota bacterium]
MEERTLAERLITYDTSQVDQLRAAAGFVKGWLESREVPVTERDHDGLPVLMAEVGPAHGPVVILHGHLDVVPGREGQFTPRVEGDRLIGRGAYDMKGGLGAMMCALKDAAAQDAVRVRFVCVPDEESEDVSRRSTDELIKDGLRADFAITGEPTDLHIGVQAKGVLAVRVQISGTAAHGSTPW